MGFYSGDSEGHLRGHQKSKVSSEVPWERPFSVSRASSLAQTSARQLSV